MDRMGANGGPAADIPLLHLSGDLEALERGSKQWERAVEEVKGALETHGYLVVRYDAISSQERERLHEAMHSVFDLPVETKAGSYNHEDVLPTYLGKSSAYPLYETLRFDNAAQKEGAEAFTRLMWPGGNDEFCEAVHSVGSKMAGLTRALMGMILDGYGLGKHQEAVLDSSLDEFRLVQYSTPEGGGQSLGLGAHADIGYITVIGHNDVAGLVVRSKQGDWVEFDPAQGYFVALVGHSLLALTNGRIAPTYHQVHITGGTKIRVSYGLFLAPKADYTVDALPETVDAEHPRLFKPYPFREFVKQSLLQGLSIAPPLHEGK